MKKEMTIMGIAPKLAPVLFPYLILVIAAKFIFPQFLKMNFLSSGIHLMTGAVLLVLGIAFYIPTVKIFLAEYKKGKLITKGTYGVCRHPIYSTWVFFVIPALAFFLESYFILSASVIFYIALKVFINDEEKYLENKYGSEYKEYKKRVNQFLPLPKF